jgi:hypothetical protein
MSDGFYLDLIHIADSMVEFNWPPSFHVCLICCIAVYSSLSRRSGRQGLARIWPLPRTCAALGQSTSLPRVVALVESSIVGCSLNKEACAILNRRTKLCLRTLDAMLRSLLLPLATSFGEQGLISCGRTVTIALVSASCDRLNRGAHRCGDSYCIRIVASAALDTVTGR